MIDMIYTASLRLWRQDYSEQFSKYLAERGVPQAANDIASRVLEQVTAGRQSVTFGIDAYKQVIIVASPMLDIYARISDTACELLYNKTNERRISWVPLKDYSDSVFILDLVQAYSLAAGRDKPVKEEQLCE